MGGLPKKVPKVILQVMKVNPLGIPGHHPFDELFGVAPVVVLLAIRGDPGTLGELFLEPAPTRRHEFGGIVLGVTGDEGFH